MTETSQEADICSSASEEAVLELLQGSGLGREQALTLINHQPEQSSLMPVPNMPHSDEVETNQSAQPSVMMTLERLNWRLNDLSTRDRQSHPTTANPAQMGAGRAWADIPVDEIPDYFIPVVWEDEADDSATGPLWTVSESTETALQAAFSRPLNNQAQLQARKLYMFPDVDTTKCLKLDLVPQQLLQKEQKQAVASLAKLQTFILDAVAPLVHIVEETQKGVTTSDQAADAAKTTLSLLGNTTEHKELQ